MPGIIKQSASKSRMTKLAAAQWIECQARLLQTYRQIRANLDQMEQDLVRARKKIEHWHRRQDKSLRRLSLSPFSSRGSQSRSPSATGSEHASPAPPDSFVEGQPDNS